MKLLFSLLLLSCIISSVFIHGIARGGLHSDLPSGDLNNSSHARHLFEDNTFQTQISGVDMAHGYMTNLDLEIAIKDFGQRCSNISKIYSIGKSVNGVPLWVIEISDKPGEEEAEPAFKKRGEKKEFDRGAGLLLKVLAKWRLGKNLGKAWESASLSNASKAVV
ncbi:carboxypeptidase SOL1 [Senna tora]|uniref:Carboxypeptidase SOL1 n=1 Tax=Senna tora TaxID=362788 RepID=A0A834TGL0_9FABA|nr:carboxypeptidase SOL1 [Senna tora]